MKLSKVSKVVSAGAIAASLAIFPLTVPAQAQTQNQNTAPDTTYNRQSRDVDATNTHDNTDWGWLGLLGLAGLAGLLPKKRHETVNYSPNEPDVAVRSRSDLR
jgi:LPXTG-motif cell wall-anchored protein